MANPTTKRSIRWPGLLGIAISVGLLIWTLRDVHFSEFVEHVRTANVWALVGTAVFATLTFVVRTYRWRAILQFEGQALPWIPLWHATAIGFMANNVLPARVGEVARAFAIQKMTGVPFSTAAASIVLARIMDGLTVLGLLFLGAAMSGISTGATIAGQPLQNIMIVAAVIFFGLFATATVMAGQPDRVTAILTRILPARLGGKVVRIVRGLLDGLAVLRDWRRALVVIAWSLLTWTVNGVSFWLCVVAFNLDIGWPGALVLQSMIAFSVALPSAPGFFGVLEGATRATLQLYSVAAALAVSYAVSYHLITYVPITVLGLFSLSRAHLHLGDLGRPQTTET